MLLESFSVRMRDELLNVNEFSTMQDAREELRAWQHEYIHHHRPHSHIDVNRCLWETGGKLKSYLSETNGTMKEYGSIRFPFFSLLTRCRNQKA